jgi:hypothetical protein
MNYEFKKQRDKEFGMVGVDLCFFLCVTLCLLCVTLCYNFFLIMNYESGEKNYEL